MKNNIIIIFSVIILNVNIFSIELITIGTGGLTGTYYPTGANICYLINKNRNTSDIRCNAISTGGSVYNIQAIMSDKFEFGIAQNDVVYQAYNGIGKFNGKPQKDLRTIFTIYSEPLTLVVTKESGIKSLNDLKGKRISIGNQGSGTRVVVDLLFDNSSLDKSMLSSVSELKSGQAIEAIKNNTLDGYFAVIGHPNSGIKLLAMEKEIDIISITVSNFPKLEQLLERFPYFTQTIIEEGYYLGIGEKETFGVKAELITSKYTSNKKVTTLVHSIMNKLESFKSLHPAYSNITKKNMFEGMSIPMHEAIKSFSIKKN